MKRIITIVFLVSVFVLGGPLSISYAQTPVVAARCTAVGDDTYELVGQNDPDEETFDPTHNRLTSVSFIWGGNLAGDKGITVSIRTPEGEVLASTVIMPTITEKGTRSWEFDSPITVTPYDTYYIRVENPSGAQLYWYTSVDSSCYTRGHARQNNIDYPFDFGFTLYGYTASTPTPTPAPTATPAPSGGETAAPTQTAVTQNGATATSTPISNTVLNPGSEAGTGEAPATSTSSTIKEPTKLTMGQITVSEKPVLKLNWLASKTTDIDGYKIFRSDKENTGFKNIAKTDKKTLEFKDGEIEVGKTYYYQVRTYKTTSESKSSNTVSKKVDPVVKSTTTVFSTKTPAPQAVSQKSNLVWYILLIIALILAVTTLMLYRMKKWPFAKKVKNSTS